MNKKLKVEGIDTQILHRYWEARNKIDKKADRISNVSHMLRLMRYCHEDAVPVDPHALYFFGEMINVDICNIIESLNDFIDILDVGLVLNKQGN